MSLKFRLLSQGNRGPVIQQTGIEEKTRKERREWRGEKRWRREKGEMRKEHEEGMVYNGARRGKKEPSGGSREKRLLGNNGSI